ncbi:serine protease 41 [Otolemur garnettii]|uniref:serine protease 41 n=1 Tax=Otolemur garnettii TaxID=30611 RepID=UPI000644123E|nr:serine protease 41 [Otolemur garnettii]
MGRQVAREEAMGLWAGILLLVLLLVLGSQGKPGPRKTVLLSCNCWVLEEGVGPVDHVGRVTFLYLDITPIRVPEVWEGPCGHRDIHSLVVGGVETVRGRWPWQALVQVPQGYFCGASLLSRRWVLSAAHCFIKYNNPSKWWVQFGELTLKPSLWNPRVYLNRYRVQDIIVNPSFHDGRNDIALLRLASSVTYNKYIKPICVLSSTSMFQHRKDCWVTGWGVLNENQTYLPPPYNLQEVKVTILNNTRCNYLFKQPSDRSVIQDSMICAGAEDGSVDTCKGDSGGPLVCDKDGLWYQVGIVSWGMGCGRPNRPGIYTNISVYFDWIQKLTSYSTPRLDPSRLLLLLALLWSPQLLQLV